MGFNYAMEKRRFDKEWLKLAAGYREAGFDEAGIQAIHDYDWEWFCRCRTYENRTQILPSEVIDNSEEESHSTLFQKFSSLTAGFNEGDFESRYAWIDAVDDPVLSDKLTKLSDDDKELLTLLVFDGYTQKEVMKILGCVQSTISKKLARIKKYLL